IPVIADEYVDPEFGTGAVKITPAHDPNDWEIGERHSLEKLVVMNDDATMNAAAGADFTGLDRYAAREVVVARFEELGLLEKIDDYDSTLPTCERCGTVIEPLLSEQWFVKMDEMRDMALELMREEGLPRFFPEVPHKKVYTTWLENLRDWTISRQLWWGHQIPAWYDAAGNVYVARTEAEAFEQAGTQELTRDEDVLDTWFSSALWPFSTLGWMSEPPAVAGGLTRSAAASNSHVQPPAIADGSDLTTFYPTDVLVTGRDIIFLWVSRMVMTGLKFTGKKPFDDVIIHGTVLDRNGQRMSKTKANGIDPLDVFEKFGVDATRLTLAGSATGIDFAWRDEKVESYRNFANKIWNATRFCLMNAESAAVDHASLMEPDLPLADRWIISRLNRTALDLNKALGKYEFHTAVALLYHFFWDDFCDWYIELKKDEITAGDAASTKRIISILEIALRMLHPFMPYLTEELWLKLPGVSNGLHHPAYSEVSSTLMLTKFPPGEASAIDEAAETEMESVIEVIKRVRNIRSEMNISPSIRFTVHIAADALMQGVYGANESQILKLARAESLVISDVLQAPKASAKAVTAKASIAVPLEGLIDFGKERERISNQIAKLTEEKSRLDGQLANANFVERAPAEKVEGIRTRSAELEEQLATLADNLAALA
ncbi:MAG TPA: valine--tRNA ligase, partial [Pyrinomonadaceae bacterium]|nr:valine--tRNA ligase [Pyrinomonadaceae bacterium]